MPDKANPMILSPSFTATARRSRPVAAGFSPVTGRWVKQNAAGEVIASVAGEGAAYLVLEGLRKVSEDATYAAGGAGNNFHVPSELVRLPSAVAANEAALAFGVFVFEVDRAGLAVDVLAAAVDAPLYLATDAAIPGGAVLTAVNTGTAIAVIERIFADRIHARTLAQA